MYRVISMIFVLLFIMALQVMSLREAFTSDSSVVEAPKMCGDQPCEEKKSAEAFGSSQGGAQIQLAASRPAYHLSVA
jgi:hypothetical protein